MVLTKPPAAISARAGMIDGISLQVPGTSVLSSGLEATEARPVSGWVTGSPQASTVKPRLHRAARSGQVNIASPSGPIACQRHDVAACCSHVEDGFQL